LDTALCSLTTPMVVRGQLAAHAVVRAAADALAQWRRQPPPIAGQPLPASFLKHSEDQTVAAVAAMYEAIARRGWLGRSFSDWGVIAAASFMGRGGTAHTLQRFVQEGAWGVSPHVIPHQSLHAASGTLSQILRIHGPNFGVGGGPHACREAFLIAAALLAEGNLPGLWLILTDHEREWVPVPNAKSVEPIDAPLCEAVALALMPVDGAAEATDGPFLRIGTETAAPALGELTLSELIGALAAPAVPRPGRWRFPSGWVELEVVTLGVGSRR
jgi:hypothetical protein